MPPGVVGPYGPSLAIADEAKSSKMNMQAKRIDSGIGDSLHSSMMLQVAPPRVKTDLSRKRVATQAVSTVGMLADSCQAR